MRGSSVVAVLALGVWLVSGAGTDARTDDATPAATGNGSDCAGAEAWLEATWERHERAALVTQRVILLLEQVPSRESPLDSDQLNELSADLLTVSQDLRVLAREQAESHPPRAAEEFDALLAERLEKYTDGAELFARALTPGERRERRAGRRPDSRGKPTGD